MRIFDTHAHYNDSRFLEDIDEVINKCKNNNVKKIVNISSNTKESIDLDSYTEKLNTKHTDIDFYYTIGVHPDEIVTFPDNNEISENYDIDFNSLDKNNIVYKYFNILKDILNKKINNYDKMVAVGEIGLDYYGDNKNDLIVRNNQKAWFVNQIRLANEYKLPIVIHSRDAIDDTYEILKKHLDNNKAVMHCYSYNVEYLKKYLDLGLYIGIGGVLTFKNGVKLKEAVKYCPLDKIVLETDSPYLAPTPFRGQRNDSSYIKYVLEELSNIKNISIDELSEICWNNSLKLYNLEG